MSITITPGWWILPFVVTVTAFAVVYLYGPKMSRNSGGMFPDAAGAIMELASYLVALVVAMTAWLAWGLLS